MARDRTSGDDALTAEAVLAALDDPDSRTIIHALEEPMTAHELSDACDIPLSTMYRKLDQLSEATLLTELTEVRSDGRHTTRYSIDFEEVRVGLDEDNEFTVSIDRPPQSADEHLAYMWSEVREET